MSTTPITNPAPIQPVRIVDMGGGDFQLVAESCFREGVRWYADYVASCTSREAAEAVAYCVNAMAAAHLGGRGEAVAMEAHWSRELAAPRPVAEPLRHLSAATRAECAKVAADAEPLARIGQGDCERIIAAN